MRLLIATIVIGMLFSFLAMVEPGKQDTSVIVFFSPTLSRDDVFQRSIAANVSIKRFLGTRGSAWGTFAVVDQADLTEASRKAMKVKFVMSAFGLAGCDGSTSLSSSNRGLSLG